MTEVGGFSILLWHPPFTPPPDARRYPIATFLVGRLTLWNGATDISAASHYPCPAMRHGPATYYNQLDNWTADMPVGSSRTSDRDADCMVAADR